PCGGFARTGRAIPGDLDRKAVERGSIPAAATAVTTAAATAAAVATAAAAVTAAATTAATTAAIAAATAAGPPLLTRTRLVHGQVAAMIILAVESAGRLVRAVS